jgi:hypothetical protein
VQDSTGIFVTSVDLFFSRKDDSLPVTVEIRTMEGGIPSNVIIPFSQVTIRPDEITTSFNAQTSTKFTFSSPVYLSGPTQQNQRSNADINRLTKEYCLVVYSPSPKYEVFTATIGQQDLNPDIAQRASKTPSLRGLFKPQISATWSESETEMLKFVLNRASFTTDDGLVRFFNPTLDTTRYSHVTSNDNFIALSKKIVVGLGSTGYNPSLVVPGVTITQDASGATAKLIGIGGSISTGVGVTISTVGTGYTNGTFTNVSLVTETGFGKDAKATIGVVSSGIATVTITSGGSGYVVGDSLLVGDIGQNVGFGGKLTVISTSSNNSLVLDNVQGTFTVGLSTLRYTNSSGVTTSIGAGVTVSSITEDQYYDGLHMKVIHPNHDMNSTQNYVKISKFRPEFDEVNSTLTSEVTSAQTTPISLSSTTGFDTFEGLAVSASNPGYIIIGNEVIEYTGISSNTLTGITRSIDAPFIRGTSTQISYGAYPLGTYVYKYETNGISLRRINKVHNFAEVDNTSVHPIDLDSYFIKIDMSDTDFNGNSIGRNRTSDLYFSRTRAMGQYGTNISQNIQFSTLQTTVKNAIPPSTNLSARLRSFSGTSSNGNESSFVDNGYVDVSLDNVNYFDSPQLIASKVNEDVFTTESPGNRSLTLEMLMTSTDDRVSPMIDLEETSLVLGSYRLNQPISTNEYSTDDRVRSLYNDPHAAIYISRPIFLSIPANSLKVLLSGYIGQSGNIRVLYRLFRNDNPAQSINYELFPGYSNYEVDGNGIKRVIDPSANDGTQDTFVSTGSNSEVKDYEYSVDDLEYFDGFSIKVILSGTNQADPPVLSDIRAIATVKPNI